MTVIRKNSKRYNDAIQSIVDKGVLFWDGYNWKPLTYITTADELKKDFGDYRMTITELGTITMSNKYGYEVTRK